MQDDSLRNFMRQNWDRLIESAEEEQFLQTFVLENAEGQTWLILAPWDSHQEKMLALFQIMRMLNEHEAVRYFFMAEVWLSAAAAKGGGRPSQQEDRQSAIWCVAVNRDGAIEGQTAFIDIDADGKRRLGVPEMIAEPAGQYGGRLIELFDGARRLANMPPAVQSAMDQLFKKVKLRQEAGNGQGA
jgi:hypothetical protein